MVTLDRGIIGSSSPTHTVEVERGRLRFFAEATGQNNPVYVDVEAAKAAGHRDLPVPPTFLFCLNMAGPNPSQLLLDQGIDLRACLHGTQRFTYHAQACAGDELTFSTSITDVYEKKGGALGFIDRTTRVTRGGELIAELVCTVVVRELEAGK
jgi:acyl dehydratase